MATNQEQWEPCPQGELTQMLAGCRARTTRQRVDRVATIGACLMVLIAASGYFLGVYGQGPGSDGHFGGIACSEVSQLLPQYIAGNLEQDQADQVAAHLANCEMCRPKYEQIKHSNSLTALMQSALLIALPNSLLRRQPAR